VRKQIPETWDRWEVIRFLEEILKEELHAWKVRITSVEDYDNFGKRSIFVHYQVNMTTIRFQIPNPDKTKIFDFDMVESHMISYNRDKKINDLLN
jgi:hypothetical protein